MGSKIEFTPKSKKGIKEFILKTQKEKTIFNFLNLYSVYLYKKDKDFKDAIDARKNNSINSIDSSTISVYFMAKRLRGTDFTRFLLKDKDLMEGKRHFFLGSNSANKKDIEKIAKRFNLDKNKLFYYNPSYIKGNKFSKEEIEKMVKFINDAKADYLWIGVGNPKQEMLTSDLYDRINVNFIFNIGAALDFIAGNKKESPRTIQRFGLEWLYRGITDFRYSNKKVFRSFLGLFYIPRTIKLKKN
ncbi:MAG: WecB/TagA/CpsF family glycosyltransferase [Nanoarchaeota archaeon]